MTMVCAASAWALIGCASPNRAPVEDHSAVKPAPQTHPAVSATETSRVAAAAANTVPAVETRSPTYTVKPGDTLIGISYAAGQSMKDVARWNNVENPDRIEVGQVLRVIAPVSETTSVTTTTTTTSAATFKPLSPMPAKASDARAGSPPASGSSGLAATPLPPVASTAAVPLGASVPLTGVAISPAPAARDSDDDLVWAWPAAGPVVAPFDDAKTKGLAIAGKAGDPVYAAADGRVVYAGSGLRGYGNLVIVKHNANYLTAYAHNQTLLVKEDQIVKRGQKIAEMGATDTDRVQLHFEIRKQGKPIDPARLLPSR
ncbi:MAG: peptidoglycan DD-metalloendopeptidase family protein [Burkholderiaceae bacterium]